ncbi:MAG TPA: class I SAM-dependent methyltransferase [Actinopolymorphaceae bacterium]|nr:class I SAM-dependent methyltransferase [Actinopolymorphaceae bacterium]
MTLPPLSPNAWLRWDLVSRLLPPDAHTVLEVGCGQGGFGVRLAQRYRYLGLEPDRASFEVARARFAATATARGAEVRNGDLSVVGPAETFDVVCAFEVLEHIEHDAKAVAEWADRLRPGGWLILSTPAFQHRFGPADVMVGHHRRYDPPVMAQVLGDAGLTSIDVHQFGGGLGYVLEAGRNLAGRYRMATRAQTSMAEKTGGSGRLFQPTSGLRGAITDYGTLPFRWWERRFPGHGPGLVARAQAPA